MERDYLCTEAKKTLKPDNALVRVPLQADSRPIVTMARARGGSKITVEFIPMCTNGQITKTPNNVPCPSLFFSYYALTTIFQLCSDNPPQINGWYVILNSISSAVGKSGGGLVYVSLRELRVELQCL